MSPQSYQLKGLAEVVTGALVRQGRRYHARSRGWAPWRAPESMYREAAAEAVHRSLRLHVVTEMTVDNVMSYGRGESRGKRPRGSGSGRIDLTVLDQRPMPSALIELKCGFGGKSIHADVARLRNLLGRGSVRYGLVAVHAVTTVRSIDDGAVYEFAKNAGIEVLHVRSYWKGWDTPDYKQNVRLLVAAVMRV